MNRRGREIAERVAERRRREEAAPALSSIVPELAQLDMNIEERRAGTKLLESTHIRRVVVEHARALFVLPCGDRACKEGGHDITAEVLHALRAGKNEFEGEDPCVGQTGSASCQRVLRYVAHAEYRS
ncbi:MAG TPA: hypothetical protein VKZ49_15100 [Polyangiaceae bacterium]|nr:hypothetical protein [Polyangiaceae bacterium]